MTPTQSGTLPACTALVLSIEEMSEASLLHVVVWISFTEKYFSSRKRWKENFISLSWFAHFFFRLNICFVKSGQMSKYFIIKSQLSCLCDENNVIFTGKQKIEGYVADKSTSANLFLWKRISEHCTLLEKSCSCKLGQPYLLNVMLKRYRHCTADKCIKCPDVLITALKLYSTSEK